jgi:hypothetical protein
MIFLKLISIAKMIREMTTVPIMTTTALFCNSDQVGQDTLCINSVQVS